MRYLNETETKLVSGGGSSCYDPCYDPCARRKNNNGYGNGAESGPPPGNSGDHNPQLLGRNRGPRGPR